VNARQASQLAAKQLGMTELEFHMAQYMPEVFTAPSASIHAEMDDLLMNRSRLRVAIDAFRGSTKSTRMSKGYLSWLVTALDDAGDYLINKIYLFCRTGGPGSLSAQWMRFLQGLVTGQLECQLLYQHDFGVSRGDKWNEDFCRIKRLDGSYCEVHALGKGSSARGARDLKAELLFDDIQNAADQQSAAILSTDEQWLLQDVYPIALPEQRMTIIGQNLSPESLMARIENMPSFEYRRFPIEKPVGSGKSVWPALWSDEWIAAQKLDMGMDQFNAEYNCLPMVSGNPIIRKEWWRTYDSTSIQFERIKNGHVYSVLGFDGADSKADNACETGIALVSATADPDPDVYLRRSPGFHMSLKQAVNQLFVLARDIDVHRSVIESRVKEGNMGPYEEEIRAQEQILRESINAKYVRPIHDKVTRAYYIQSMIQRGKVYYDPNIPEHVELVTQACMFTGTQKFPCDRFDALIHALTEVKDHAKTITKPVAAKRVLPQGARLAVMGAGR
jgi:hypothetical protein